VSSLRALLIGLSFACGARSQLDGAAVTEDASPPPMQRLCLGVLPSTTTPRPLGEACDFGTGTGPSLVVIDGTQVSLIDRQKNVTPLFTFLANAPGFSTGRVYVVSRGKYVAAMTSAYEVAQPSNKSHIEVVVLDVTTGAKVAHDEFDGVENGGSFTVPEAIYGSDDGTFAYGYAVSTRDVAMGIISSTGKTLRPVMDMVPMADPSLDHIVPVYEQNDSGGEGNVFWFDPCTGVAAPSHQNAVMSSGSTYPLGSRITYLDYKTWTLIDEGPHDFKELALADVGTTFTLKDVNASGWGLLSTIDDYEYVTANVALGTKNKVSLKTLPAGFYLLDPLDGGSIPTGMRATSQGGMMIPLRNADHGMLYENRAGTWTPVGLAFGEVYTATPFEIDGTYLMYATWEPVPLDWPPPQGPRVEGTGTQLARPATNVAVVVENIGPAFGLVRDYAVSHDGACVLFDAGTLDIVSAVTGAKTSIDLHPKRTPSNTFASTWIEGADSDFFGSP
jgi:hypothetical protein